MAFKKPMKDKKLYQLLLKEILATKTAGEARCAHFGECGGCDLQAFAYTDQVAAKHELLLKLIAHFGGEDYFRGFALADDIETIPSPQPFGYRQRMDYVFAFDTAGLRRKNSHRHVVPLTECHLIAPAGTAAFFRARDLAREVGLESYDYLKHVGDLRYFVIRHSREGETLVSLVTKSRDNEEKITKIAETLLAEGLATSVHWLLSGELADVSFGESLRHFGESCIHEKFFGKSFLIGPNTFFQANPAVAEIGYGRIRDYARASGATEMLDLFSGTGVIAILLADLVSGVDGAEITAVDSEPSNHSLARLNLQNNNVEVVDFVPETVYEFLRANKGTQPFVVLNPPRAGVGEKTLSALLPRQPERIAYLSCNPISLIRDLAVLHRSYQVESVTLLDMFPQTRHFETLVCLRRK